MRIKMLLNRYLPVVGGAERQAQRLIRELGKNGNEITILTRKLNPNLSDYELIDEVPVTRIQPIGLSKLANILVVFTAILNLIRYESEFDVIHSHSLGPLGLASVLAAKFLKKPLILKSPGYGNIKRQDLSQEYTSLYTKFLRRFLIPQKLWTNILSQADAIIALSSQIEDEGRDAGLNNLVRIPNGVDTEIYFPLRPEQKGLLRTDLFLDANKFYLFYSGRLVKGKRIDILLEALANIRLKYPNVQLLLAGSGELQSDSSEDELRIMVQKLDLEGNVSFLGLIDNVPAYLQASDCFVFASMSEGMPNAVLEAMATGLPVIASRIAGVTDILDGSTGYLFTAGEAESFLESFLEFMANPDEANIRSQKALERVQSSYSIQAVAKQYEALYQKLLDKKNN